MSKFEQEGVDRQQKARTKAYAIYSFKHSCDICCYTGKRISCDNCAIANAHTEVLNGFNRKVFSFA